MTRSTMHPKPMLAKLTLDDISDCRYMADTCHLMQHAKTMLAPFGIQVMGHYDDALQEAIDRLMAMVPASIPRPV